MSPRNFGRLWNAFVNVVEENIYANNQTLMDKYNKLLEEYPSRHSRIETFGIDSGLATFGHRVKRGLGINITRLKTTIIAKRVIKENLHTNLEEELCNDVNNEFGIDVVHTIEDLNRDFVYLYGVNLFAYQEEIQKDDRAA